MLRFVGNLKYGHKNHKRWQSSSATSVNFTSATLDHSKIDNIKRHRVGTQLEEFKKVYDDPILNMFMSIKKQRRTLSNRKARNLIVRIPSWKREKILKEKRKQKIEDIERKILQVYNDDEPDWEQKDFFRASQEVIRGRTPEERRARENLLKIPHAAKQDRMSIKAEYTWDDPPLIYGKKGARAPDTFDWEIGLDEEDLAKTVAQDLDSIDITPYFGRYITRRSDIEAKKFDAAKTSTPAWKYAVYFDRGTYKYTADRPRVLLDNVPLKIQATRYKLERLTDETPIAFETTHKPSTGEYYDRYTDRKVKLHIKVGGLYLPKLVRKRFIALANSKGYFNPGRDTVVISYQKEHTKTGNRAYCVRIFRELLHEAWKADLNYLPPPDKLEPLQQVIAEKEARDNPPKEFSFADIKASSKFTIFRLYDWPDPQKLEERKELAGKQFVKLFKTLSE